ncbi:MAG: ComF family protein, partial [Candidatus Eisenbacteria bacterium]|nr:ComF family protein [Candidatus Latescibacterota bacterium]MBD3303371.1 ComF family protein [Candidatus Eisenbacteria bacterium]
TVLVPVPLHPARFRERGFNQAERLAREVGRRLALPVRTDLLRRRRWEGSQTSRIRQGRAAAVSGAFTAAGEPPAQRILLVDDVWTTGATVRECRRVLLAAGGIPPIGILVAARTPRIRTRQRGS